MAAGNEVDLIDQFIATLPKAQQSRHHRLSNVRKVCRDVQSGQSCELIVQRHGLRRMGLLDRFARYACQQAVCTEQAICEAVHRRHH
jgi:hypothetical protein